MGDKKRGKIKCIKDETGVFHLTWHNRISKQQELDLTIFPGTAKWEKVEECKDGRVFLLRLLDAKRKHFFWMQEPTDEKDEEYSTNINKLCQGQSLGDEKANDSNTASGATGAAAQPNPFGALGGQGGGGNDALTQLLLNAMQAQGAGGAMGGAQGQGQNSGNLLQQMAQTMQGQQQQALEEMKREPDLEDVLDPAANPEIAALLDDEKVVEQLAEHLPEGMRTREDMMNQLQSPQFQGALRQLQRAVNGPQMQILLQQMGVNAQNPNAVGTTAFLEAIQGNNPPDSNSTDDDGDSAMSESSKDKKDESGDKK